MKKYFLPFLLVFVLSACSPPSALTPTGQPPAQATEPVPIAPTSIPAAAPTSAISWDTSPQTLVVTATFCCGLAPQHVEENYIPDAQVWGDGRIVWVEYAPDGGRRVLEAKLDQAGLEELLKGVNEQGFFGWQEMYTERLAPKDQPTKCLQIQAEGMQKRVCEYYRGAPQAFHDFYTRVSTGAGLEGQEYVPEKAYLKVYPQGQAQTADQEAPAWDSSRLNYSLEEAENGAWVEGPVLVEAWKLLNGRPWGLTVRQDGQLYLLSLQVPGLSMIQPPAN